MISAMRSTKPTLSVKCDFKAVKAEQDEVIRDHDRQAQAREKPLVSVHSREVAFVATRRDYGVLEPVVQVEHVPPEYSIGRLTFRYWLRPGTRDPAKSFMRSEGAVASASGHGRGDGWPQRCWHGRPGAAG